MEMDSDGALLHGHKLVSVLIHHSIPYRTYGHGSVVHVRGTLGQFTSIFNCSPHANGNGNAAERVRSPRFLENAGRNGQIDRQTDRQMDGWILR